MPTDEIPAINLNQTNLKLNQLNAVERIIWLYRHFDPKTITLTTSGGETSSVIPHLMRTALQEIKVPEPSIIFIDTGYYASSTLGMVRKLEVLGFQIQRYQPLLSPLEIEKKYPNWEVLDSENFQKVKEIIKREPMNRIIQDRGTNVWMSGIMREETVERKNKQILEYDQERKIYHFHPIADWRKQQALEYIKEHSLPTNTHHFDIAKGPDQNLECGIHTNK
jgi:3'-phosphoadenosine 5'-phosphosulfate sulfotransferase (PAPS reductase)/FAD synthetase